MTALYAPQPLRVIVAWQIAADDLRRALTPLANVTPVEVDALNDYLAKPIYYHVLHIALANWRTLAPVQRQKFAGCVNLVVLSGGVATAEDLTQLRTGIYFTAALPEMEAINVLVELHARLKAKWTLTQCVNASKGNLALIGNEACWDDSDSSLPVAAASSDPKPHSQPQSSSPLPTPVGILIQQVNVRGDVVGRDKVVIQSSGDQTVHAHIDGATRIEQKAGRDQVNINHVDDDSPTLITQTAGEDQVNVNTVTSNPIPKSGSVKVCLKCKHENEEQNQFCKECGHPLG